MDSVRPLMDGVPAHLAACGIFYWDWTSQHESLSVSLPAFFVVGQRAKNATMMMLDINIDMGGKDA